MLNFKRTDGNATAFLMQPSPPFDKLTASRPSPRGRGSIQFACGFVAVAVCMLANFSRADNLWVEYKGADGAGKGKHVVLMAGDEEYRSEEGLPQLGKILAKHHGFDCTVLFSINPKDGTINPNEHANTPGIEALDKADLLVLLTRFRDLPDDQMKHFVDYVESGRPIIGLRTATHAFQIPGDKKYADYSWNNHGGFGRRVLGETWVSHWGGHMSQSTRGIVAPGQENNPILRGIGPGEIWGPTDVYEAHPPKDCTPVVLGQVLEGMKYDDKPLAGKKNDPMMPIAWTRTFTGKEGKPARIFTTTMGSSTDLATEGTRRMVVNACYWALRMEDKIPEKSNVELVGEFKPLPYRGDGFKKGVKPGDLK
jgi:hypothetical protein